MSAATPGTAAPVVLRAEKLGRQVGAKTILSDISFDVAVDDLLGIVGASGSGKSSLLRLLNRLDEPTSGVVYVDGQDYRQLPPRELRRRVGMVTQRPFLFPGDVASNLRFGPAQRGEICTGRRDCSPARARGPAGIRHAGGVCPLWRRAAKGLAGTRAGQPS